ncbi:MAG: hypothetical protein ACYTFI_22645, partial [Planctomycetota bacterium]
MKRHRRQSVSLCLLVVGSAAVAGYAGEQRDWPRWRGPDGNSITSESGWRPESLLPAPKILWRANVGYGYSSVCIK